MVLLECATRNDLPTYNYVISLDGVNYNLSYYFNPRMDSGNGKWFLQIADQTGNILVAAVPIVVTWPLLDRFVDQEIPPGMLMGFDTSGQNKDPGQFELGDRVRVLYLESEGT